MYLYKFLVSSIALSLFIACHKKASGILGQGLRPSSFWFDNTVQVGQYLSSRGDVMPEPWVRALSGLQDSMPFRTASDLKNSLQLYYGKPLEEIFLSFDDIPLASASIAQVHKAVLKNGQAVLAMK